MNEWKVVSYYTSSYKDIAYKYLIPSLTKLNIDNHIIEIPELHGWKASTDYKATYIKTCLGLFKTNIVWLDCDAIVNSYPSLFDEIPVDFDFAVHYVDPRILYTNSGRPIHAASGTIFVRDNETSHQLLDDWIKLVPSTRVEQMALQIALEKSNINVYELPREYCYIVTQPNGQPPRIVIDNPIISHYQASREMRRYG